MRCSRHKLMSSKAPGLRTQSTLRKAMTFSQLILGKVWSSSAFSAQKKCISDGPVIRSRERLSLGDLVLFCGLVLAGGLMDPIGIDLIL